MKSLVAGPFALSSLDTALVHAIGPSMWIDRIGGLLSIDGAGADYPGDAVIIKPSGKVIRIGQRGLSFTGIGWAHNGIPLLKNADGVRGVQLPSLAEVSFDATFTQDGVTSFASLPDRYIWFDGDRILASTGGVVTVEHGIYTPATSPILIPDFEVIDTWQQSNMGGYTTSQAYVRVGILLVRITLLPGPYPHRSHMP